MTPLNQRDPRWANTKLGTSELTLGQAGCTITTLAMLLGTTPDIVNEKLKALVPDAAGNTGFARGNLVYWARIPEAFPGATVRRVWAYDNEDVKNNLPVIVEVDGSPIGAPTHFVLYIGDQKLIDPWDGQIKPTNTYVAKSYAVVKPPVVQENYLIQLQKQIEATNQCQTQLQTALAQAQEYQKQSASYISQIAEYKVLVDDLTRKYADEQNAVINLKTEIAKIHSEDKNYGQEALDAQYLAKERGDFLHMIADELETQYDPTDDKKLVEDILQELVRLKQQQEAVPLESELQAIIKQFINMGINKYLEAKGLQPLDPNSANSELVEKVSLYLNDVANELLNLNPQAAPSPVIESVKPKRNILRSLVKALLRPFVLEQ